MLINRRKLLVATGLLAVLIAAFLNGEFGLGDGPVGEVTQDALNTQEDSTLEATSEDTISQTLPDTTVEIIEPKDVEDSLALEFEDSTLVEEQAEGMDSSLITDSDTLILEEDTESESPYNTIKVLKKSGQLVYEINGVSYENLVLGLTELDFEKETFLKLAGNLTYAEEKEVKAILEGKEIQFSESK